MKFLLLILILLIIYLIFKFLKSLNYNIIITIICSLLIIQIILSPKLCIDSALSGAKLFFSAVFPSLFPFLIIINMIIAFDGISIYSKVFGNILCKPLQLPKQCSIVLIISSLCGYPLGAKYTCELYEKKLIDLQTAQRLLSIASNASPLFVIGAVGTSMLGNTTLGYLLLLSNFLSCVLIGFFFKGNSHIYELPAAKIKEIEDVNIGKGIRASIEDAVKTTLLIGGYVTIYSVIISIIKNNALFDIVISKFFHSYKEVANSSILGLLEMTNGCHMISSSTIAMWVKVVLISFMISFSGLSIISQVYSFTYKHPLSITKYMKLKIIQGILCSGVSLVLYKIFFNKLSLQTFNIIDRIKPVTSHSLYLIIIIFIIFPVFISTLKKLFHIS